jgi:hypothetical protein
MSVADYFDRCTDSLDYGAGALEVARDKAERTSRAVGRLCEVLHTKVFLTLDDMSTISGGFENIEGIIE